MTNNTNAPTEWVAVPRVATEEMLMAAELSKPRGYSDLYRALIEAAPPAPEAVSALSDDQILAGYRAMLERIEYAGPQGAIQAFREAVGGPAPEAGARMPLTDEQITAIWSEKPRWHAAPIGDTDLEFARAIERAHGIRGEE